MSEQNGHHKTKIGTVVSDKMNKTIVVEVTKLREHPLYHKKYKVTQKFKTHNIKEKVSVGDLVEIIETRPLSKEKSWQLNKIIQKGTKNDSTI